MSANGRRGGPRNAEDALRLCEELFDTYDADGSGFIDAEEATKLIRNYHATEGVGRAIKAVREEVQRAMLEFDHDGSGQLDFGEFIALFTSGMFKFSINKEPPSYLYFLAAPLLSRLSCSAAVSDF